MNITKFFEILGVDLIPYAIGLSKFNSKGSIETQGLKKIREQVRELNAKKLDDALSYSKELLAEESIRGEKIESKAFNLMGVTAISAAFITSISGLIPKETQIIFPFQLAVLILIYLLIVISLTLTVLLASRVVIVGDYKFAFPDIADVFKMNTQSTIETKKDRLSSYLYCYENNFQIHNVKASYLIGSQLWFRNSVVMFLLLALILAPSFLNDIPKNTQPLATGTATLVSKLQQTSSVISTTQTLGLPTNTVQIQPTIKPIGTPILFQVAPSPTADISTFGTITP